MATTDIVELKKFYKILEPRFSSELLASNSTIFNAVKEKLIDNFYSTYDIFKYFSAEGKNVIFRIDNFEQATKDIINDFKFEEKTFNSGSGSNTFNNKYLYYSFADNSTTPNSDGENINTPIIISFNDSFSLGTRKVEEVDLFLNAIPTVEMSKCTPYFDFYFEFDDKNKIRPVINEIDFFKSRLEDINRGGKFSQQTEKKILGMEAFLLPQSIRNDIFFGEKNPLSNIPNDTYNGLISIDGINIDISPTKGLMSYKKATCNLKIHDRTKLKYFAQFLKPELFSKLSIVVAYGWIHPVESDNIYADFINNNMLVREVYNVSNASYSFEQNGAVNVDLELTTKLAKELVNITVGMTENDVERYKKLAEISSKLETLLNDSEIGKKLFTSSEGSEENKKNDILPKRLIQFATGGSPVTDLTIQQIKDAFKMLDDFRKSINNIETEEKNTAAAAAINNIIELLTDFISLSLGNIDETIKGKIKTEMEKPDTGLKNSSAESSSLKIIYDILDKSDIKDQLKFNKTFSDFLQINTNKKTEEAFKNINKKDDKYLIIFFKKLLNVANNSTNNFDKNHAIKLLNVLKSGFTNEKLATTPGFKDVSQEKLENMYNVPQESSENSEDDILRREIANATADLFKYLFQINKSDSTKDLETINKSLFDRQQIITFGHLFENMILNGMKLTKSRDDKANLQILFYTFNEKAGDILNGLPISAFPIEIKQFTRKYLDYISKKGDDSFTVEEFLTFFVENEINDPRTISNPQSQFYKAFTVNAEGKDTIEVQKSQQANLDTFNLSDTRKIPIISCLVETSYLSSGFLGETLISQGIQLPTEGKITKIHIFDTNHDPYTIKGIEYRSNEKDFIVNFTNSNFVELIPNSNDEYELQTNLKEVLSKQLPTIVIGSNNSNVISFSLQTNQNPKDSAVRIIQDYKDDYTLNNQTSKSLNLPMRIIPAQLSLTVVGCPIIYFGQKLFVDLGTGTTADTIYCVTGIQHQISSGKFETSLTLTVNEGYAQFENAIRTEENPVEQPKTKQKLSNKKSTEAAGTK